MNPQGNITSHSMIPVTTSILPPPGMPKAPKVPLPETPKDLLIQAAAPAFQQIEKDHDRVSDRLRPLLGYLRENLFNPDLNVNQLKRGCDVRDNSIVIRFRDEVEHTPKAYITGLRLETGARLLRDTKLKIWQISSLLGYSALGVFSKAFYRWSGLRPRRYRKESRQRQKAQQPEPIDVFDNDLLVRALKGRLDANEAHRLIHRLCALYQCEQEELVPDER